MDTRKLGQKGYQKAGLKKKLSPTRVLESWMAQDFRQDDGYEPPWKLGPERWVCANPQPPQKKNK